MSGAGRILVFGRSGQVAQELARLKSAGREIICLGRDTADLATPGACAAAIAGRRPDAVINAAAHTAVDRAETEEGVARRINAEAPGEIARACALLGVPMVQLSTDYVFPGSGSQPHRPGDPTGPLNAYGRTKLAGETAVRAAAGHHAILRTSWVFSAHGQNFVKTMLRLGAERPALRVVADQVGGPTPAAAIARACVTIAEVLQTKPDKTGTYHFSGAPDLSWADFAREILGRAGLATVVEDIATTDYPTPAARPRNSRLDCSSTRQAFGLDRPDWRAGLAAVLAEILAPGAAEPGAAATERRGQP